MSNDGYDFRDGDLLLRRARNGGYVMVVFEENLDGKLSADDGTYGAPVTDDDEAGDLASMLLDVMEHFGNGFSKHDPKSRGAFVAACTYEQRERMLDILHEGEPS